MKEIDNSQVCQVVECFACHESRCTVLIDNNFGGRRCPFFKTKEQVEGEDRHYNERLANIKKGG